MLGGMLNRAIDGIVTRRVYPADEVGKEIPMSTSDAAVAFQAMVKHYESSDWSVRTIDYATLRAFVRARTSSDDAEQNRRPAQDVDTTSRCRKLWVDSTGQVQETNVPC